MAKPIKKKSAKEASEAFHKIMKASMTIPVQPKEKEKNKDFIYISDNNPHFKVAKITKGYRFIFYDKNGEETKRFSIDSTTVGSDKLATGHEGDDGKAIEIFRKYLKENSQKK